MIPKDYDSQLFYVSPLQENDEAFLDDPNWKIKFLPKRFVGLAALKTRHEYMGKRIKFDISGPIEVYIAIDESVEPPLGNNFKRVPVEMAILKINSKDGKNLVRHKPVLANIDIGLNV